MTCCSDFDKLMDLELARHAQPYQLTNGRILTEIDTEYYFVFAGLTGDNHEPLFMIAQPRSRCFRSPSVSKNLPPQRRRGAENSKRSSLRSLPSLRSLKPRGRRALSTYPYTFLPLSRFSSASLRLCGKFLSTNYERMPRSATPPAARVTLKFPYEQHRDYSARRQQTAGRAGDPSHRYRQVHQPSPRRRRHRRQGRRRAVRPHPPPRKGRQP